MPAKRKNAKSGASAAQSEPPVKKARTEVVDLVEDDDPAPGVSLLSRVDDKVQRHDPNPLLDYDSGIIWARDAGVTLPLSSLADMVSSKPAPMLDALYQQTSFAKALRELDQAVAKEYSGVVRAAPRPPPPPPPPKRGGRGKKGSAKPRVVPQGINPQALERSADAAIRAKVLQCATELREMPRGSSGTVMLPLYPDFAAAATGSLTRPLCSLLRNDSMIDMSKRCELYHSVFELLKAASSSGELCTLLQHGTPSVVSLLENMEQQAALFVQGTLSIMDSAGCDDDGDDDTIAAQSMAMTIRDSIEAVRRHVAENAILQPAASTLQSEPSAQDEGLDGGGEEAAQYIEALSKKRVEMVPLVSRHVFAKQVRESARSSTEMMKRMKELSTMATNLPVTWDSGIFLRVDEERNDALKALIIGPAGTPYENGCFTFDIYLPPTYPDVPPQVQLVDTSGGNIRMNPNLYANGKVCLSLLGTWSGPGWIPGKSTLLQVLLSIQALILVSEPYYNEPGYENEGKERALGYNEYIRLFTVKVGMLEQLGKSGSVFQDVIQTHFRLKKAHISRQIKSWLSQSRLPKASPPDYCFPAGTYGMGRQVASPATPHDVKHAALAALARL